MQIDDKLKKIYSLAVKKWGLEAQVGMLIEECAELIKASHKAFMRSNGSVLDFMEELVDVEIMVEQLKVYINDDVALDNIKQIKINRLKKLLENK